MGEAMTRADELNNALNDRLTRDPMEGPFTSLARAANAACSAMKEHCNQRCPEVSILDLYTHNEKGGTYRIACCPKPAGNTARAIGDIVVYYDTNTFLAYYRPLEDFLASMSIVKGSES